MPANQWREQTEVLKHELTDAIASKREAAFESTIPNYLCLNNLKSKLARLVAIERNLAIDKYMLGLHRDHWRRQDFPGDLPSV